MVALLSGAATTFLPPVAWLDNAALAAAPWAWPRQAIIDKPIMEAVLYACWAETETETERESETES